MNECLPLYATRRLSFSVNLRYSNTWLSQASCWLNSPQGVRIRYQTQSGLGQIGITCKASPSDFDSSWGHALVLLDTPSSFEGWTFVSSNNTVSSSPRLGRQFSCFINSFGLKLTDLRASLEIFCHESWFGLAIVVQISCGMIGWAWPLGAFLPLPDHSPNVAGT